MMPAKIARTVVKSVVIGLLLTGCAGPESPTASPSVSTPVAVAVHKTGGFAGVDETITIDAQGNWRKAGFNVTKPSGALTADQLAKLQSLAADPRIADEAKAVRSPGQCNDTFHYKVTIGGQVVTFDECPSDPNPPQATMALLAHVTEAVR